MNKNILLSVLLMFVGISLGIAVEPPPFKMPKEFSVDMEMSSQNGQKVVNKMFVSDQKSRMESSMGGQQMIMITRLDKRFAYHIMPDQKSYMEMPLPEQSPKTFGPPEDAVWKAAGSEKIDGVDCDKYEATIQPKQQGSQVVKLMHWIRKDKKTLARVESGGNITNWKNLKEGKQDAQLFEIPAGYKKMDMSAMMQHAAPPPPSAGQK